MFVFSLVFLSGLSAEEQNVQRDAVTKLHSTKSPPVAPAWPAKANPAGFDVVQTNDDGSDQKHLVVKNTKTGETLEFDAEGRMLAPDVLEPSNGWPQIELQCSGPPEFYLRKLYRVEDDDYRCVRTDELTRINLQAPEGAPVVRLGEDFNLYWIRAHETKPGDPAQSPGRDGPCWWFPAHFLMKIVGCLKVSSGTRVKCARMALVAHISSHVSHNDAFMMCL